MRQQVYGSRGYYQRYRRECRSVSGSAGPSEYGGVGRGVKPVGSHKGFPLRIKPTPLNYLRYVR